MGSGLADPDVALRLPFGGLGDLSLDGVCIGAPSLSRSMPPNLPDYLWNFHRLGPGHVLDSKAFLQHGLDIKREQRPVMMPY